MVNPDHGGVFNDDIFHQQESVYHMFAVSDSLPFGGVSPTVHFSLGAV